jgi:hypothetical protein
MMCCMNCRKLGYFSFLLDYDRSTKNHRISPLHSDVFLGRIVSFELIVNGCELLLHVLHDIRTSGCMRDTN